MARWKQSVSKRFKNSAWYPHPWCLENPLKTIEYESVVRGISFRPGDRILDLGCGGGLQTALLARHGGHVLGIDISEGAVGRAISDQEELMKRFSLKYKCTSISDARFGQGEFDMIVSFCVLEHIRDLDVVLRECRRILKPGGRFCFSVDCLAGISDRDKAYHSHAHHVCRYFTCETLTTCLKDAGFSQAIIKPLFCSKTSKLFFLRLLYGTMAVRIRYNFIWLMRIYAAERMCRNRADGLFLVGSAS
jgi:2-polyprenyl-3-methyl-5-hydroxy-6-metoxy-1,4-benzoquinol methylase